MERVLACTTWKIAHGREEEFVARWRAITSWTLENFQGAGPGTLVQDRCDSATFLSVFQWESLERIEEWRAHEGFAPLWGRLVEVATVHARHLCTLRVALTGSR
jgi:heme-degrading monooxygenase HmoA